MMIYICNFVNFHDWRSTSTPNMKQATNNGLNNTEDDPVYSPLMQT